MSIQAIQRAVQIAGSQSSLADGVCVTQGLVSQWLRGKTRLTPERAEDIRTLSGTPKVTFDVVLASQPDTVEAGPFVCNLQTASATADTIQGTLGYEDDVFAQLAPGQNYLPNNSPGLYL